MYERFLLHLVEEALSDTPVVFLNGPRQAGKSTFAQLLLDGQEGSYVTLDDLVTLEGALADPIDFLSNGEGLMIIDEAQRAPELFLSIKAAVDRDRRPGRFLLTGSSNVLLQPKLADSLAGRMEILPLYPLSLGEIAGKEESLIKTLFAKPSSRWGSQYPQAQVSDVQERLLIGGYPEVQTRTRAARRDAWFDSYVTTVLQRDVRELANIDGLTRLPNLLKLIATRAGGLLNMQELSRTSGIAASTLNRYLILLQAVFLIHLLPAWSNHRGKRLVKAPKVYLNDTGILCYLLGLDRGGLESHPQKWGAVLETFVVTELLKQASWSDMRLSLYHYRTQVGKEVDLVLEAADGRIVGIEVKGSRNASANDFKGLHQLAEDAGDRFVRGVVFYMGERKQSFGENLFALPLPFQV